MSSKFQYFLIYKPYGMLSQFSKSNEKEITLADLNFNFNKDIYPAGRLDKDSEGLLLLSNDNKLKHRLMDPKFEHRKTYWVQVDGEVDPTSLDRFKNGDIKIKLKQGLYQCKPAKARILTDTDISVLPERSPPVRFRKNIPTTWLEIKIREGKNRQIRKMTAQIGHPTLRLIRMEIENIKLSALTPGHVEELNIQTIKKLIQ